MTAFAPQLGDLIDQTEDTAFELPEVDQSRPPEVECLCPFCGTFNRGVGKPCIHCALEDTNATRAATTQRLGPWFVLQTRNPSAPGMNFQTLQALIRRHVVTSRSVVRGPTTGQLWRLASKVRGLSREFGQCHDCGEDIERDDIVCPHCDRLQTLPETPEARGEMLEPVAMNAAVVTPIVAPPMVAPLVVEPAVAHHIEPSPGAATVMESTPIAETIPVLETDPVAATVPTAEAVSIAETSPALEKAPAVEIVEPIAAAIPESELITMMSSEAADETSAQPVAVNRAFDRHIPKDDLLTARDVAKAFLLEFGPTAVAAPGRRAIPRNRQWDYPKIKTGASLVGVLMLAALTWPVGHVVAGWFQPSPPAVSAPAPTLTAPANTAVADAHLAADFFPPQPDPTPVAEQSTAEPAAVVATPLTPSAPRPIVQPVMFKPQPPIAKIAPITRPIIKPITEPVPAPSLSDDPQILWGAGIDAEGRQNFKAAIRAYERIESLPSTSWPRGLEVRLELARKELKGDCR